MATVVIFVEDFLALLEGHEHDDVPAAEAHKVGSETLVESERAFILQHAKHDGENTGWLARCCIHYTCLQHIYWGATDHSVESSSKGTDEVSGEGRWVHSNCLHSNLLVLVVGDDLSCADD